MQLSSSIGLELEPCNSGWNHLCFVKMLWKQSERSRLYSPELSLQTLNTSERHPPNLSCHQEIPFQHYTNTLSISLASLSDFNSTIPWEVAPDDLWGPFQHGILWLTSLKTILPPSLLAAEAEICFPKTRGFPINPQYNQNPPNNETAGWSFRIMGNNCTNWRSIIMITYFNFT